ncbi:MAG TPA: aminofutalosine synthase MqnE [Bacteroidales bacterium]|jgi:aminodeoxyfutalosine synthase|nr:aminofutalosine synthase MqnE [Bacteroidales bacterium]HRS17931.1 aminofutalosine synthase MqnE [Bacteroidales bacterium]
MTHDDVLLALNETAVSQELQTIAHKVLQNQRITTQDCLLLYEQGELAFVGALADFVRFQKNENIVFFNKNIHIEPTNICIHNCTFCSYSKKKGDPLCWEMSIDEMLAIITKIPEHAITEVHIVGGVHPDRGIDFYCDLLTAIKNIRPSIQIKAFTAVEIDFMAKKSGFFVSEILQKLKDAGLQTMPGGGAEIFDESLRKIICPTKTSSERWLKIHETAHKTGIPTNATMLYGHIEKFEHRVDHLNRLRNLQDKTNGFQAFIPLKYKKENNYLGIEHEVPWSEDLRNFAISRIFLDNFKNIKAYWPMLGKELSQMTLEFGVNDFDGTINDSTKIYSMAGAEDTHPTLTEEQMVALIHAVGRKAIERDSVYNIIQTH